MTIDRSYKQRSRGVALIQVIITTSIIMLLAIFYVSMAKSQVDRARALQNKTAAYISHYSANNKVVYRLLTEDYHALQQQGWNFYGQPMQIDEHTTVAIQDLNGLLSLSTMVNESMLQKIIEYSPAPQNAPAIAQSVMDWIDGDNSALPYGGEQPAYNASNITVRNGPIQSYSEFAFINNMTIDTEQVLLTNTTVHPTPFFNPLTAPREVLAAYTDVGRADSIIGIRGSSGYDRDTVEEMAQIYDDEGVHFLIGPGFRLTISAKVDESYFGKILEYNIYPHRQRPLNVLSRLPRQQLTRSMK